MLSIMRIITGVPAGITSPALGAAISLPPESFGLLSPVLPEPLGLVPPLPPGLFGRGGGPPSFKTFNVASEEGIDIPLFPPVAGSPVPMFFGLGRRAAHDATISKISARPPATIFFSCVQTKDLDGVGTAAAATPAPTTPPAAAAATTGTAGRIGFPAAAATAGAPTTTGATAFTPKLSGCSN